MRTTSPRAFLPATAALALVLVFLIGFAGVAVAAPADLDTSFDGDGKKTIDYSGLETGQAVAIQPDGKIVVVGKGGEGHFAVTRLNPDGSFDTSFAGDGAIPIIFPGTSSAIAEAVALQSDGGIVVAGYAAAGGLSNEFAVARVNSDGSLDTSFSGDGMFAFGYAGDDRGYGVAIQPDRKIVLVGTGGVNNDWVIVRLNPDGTADPSFDFDGSLGIELMGNDVARAIALQPDGKILVVGDSDRPDEGFGGYDPIYLFRLNSDGSYDTGFGGGGGNSLVSLHHNHANAVAVQPDGKIIVAGDTFDGAGPPQAMAGRFTSDGTAVDSFFVFLFTPSTFRSVAVERSGKVVLAGEDSQQMFIVRRNADGSADATFNGGSRSIDFGSGTSGVYGMALQADGKIVIAGSWLPSLAYDVAVARLLGNTPPPPALYPRPATATPTRVPLVPGYDQCTAPNSTHRAPKLSPGPGTGDPACNPPVRTSTALTTSSTGVGSGFVKLRAVVGNPGTAADEADVAVNVTATDVRCASVSGCSAGADYPGQLILRLSTRVTDGNSNSGSATVSDARIDVPVSCTTTGGAAGSNCSVATTLDTMVPGSAPEGKLSIYDLPSIQLMDAGSDGTIGTQSCAPTCGNGDERVYLTEGVFTP
jgi:uncharacterized delta-60 repeat protein